MVPPAVHTTLVRISSSFDEDVLNDQIRFDRLLVRFLKMLVMEGVAQSVALDFIETQRVISGSVQAELQHEIMGAPFGPGARVLSHTVNTDCGQYVLRVEVESDQKQDALGHAFQILDDKVDLAFRHKEGRRFEIAIDKLVSQFLEADLQPTKGWAAIASHAHAMLPDFEPFNSRVQATRCQVMTHTSGSQYIALRADSNDDEISEDTPGGPQLLDYTKIVSGIPILQDVSSLSINPTLQHQDIYGAYLFPGKLVEAEVVVRMQVSDPDGKPLTIGVLNFENPSAGSLDGFVLKILQQIGIRLTPFVHALMNRERRVREKELGRLYVISSMLARLNADLSHRVNNATLRARLRCESYINNNDVEENIRVGFEKVKADVDVIQERSQAFLADVPAYLKVGHLRLKQVVDAAIQDALVERNRRADIAWIRKIGEHDETVYASLLLRENIKNLLVNALFAVEERLAVDPNFVPQIEVSVVKQNAFDLNKRPGISPSRVNVKISDNGVGAPSEHIHRLKEFGMTTRRETGGTGFGLPAAMDYVQSVLGGDFKYGNSTHGGFYVQFYLLSYTAELEHETTSLSRG